jgi:tetratricopeptide (TPR) repeat protein
MAGSGHRRAGARSAIGEQGAGANGRLRLPDRYQEIGLVARGGMASVWAVRDRTLDREVAVKLLAERFARDEVAVRRFKREARAAARLSGHPNVVTIYDVGQRPATDEAPFGRPYIVMEFLAGGTVADAARPRGVEPEEVVGWLHGAAAALDHAHARGVVHRDVKLSNCLLDDHRMLHVADFGIASLGTEDTLTATGYLLGTAAYLAPERALGQPATPASDRYSLAVCAYELLAGRRPFLAEEPTSLARQQIEASAAPASSHNRRLPQALDAVLERGMAKDPERRWPSAAAFAAAVEEALAAKPRLAATPRASGPAPVLVTHGGRRRGVAVLAAVAACALAAGIAAGAGGSGNSRPARAVAGGRATAHPAPPVRPQPRHAAAKPHPAAPAGTTSASAAPPAAGTPSAGPGALETRGHALMEAGSYSAAIPVLRQAVANASPGSLTYAYALFDLGHSLRLAGDPQAAVPILSRRLAIPNQTGVVRTELQLAMQAAGQRPAGPAPQPAGRPQPSGGGAPAPGDKHGKHHHDHGPSGGAAFTQNQGE